MWTGSVLDCFGLFCQLKESIVYGKSIADIDFMYPTTLVPLLSYIEKYNVKLHPDIKGYIDSIFQPPTKESNDYVLEKLEGEKRPDRMYNLMDALSEEYGNAVQYFLGELLANIFDHSEFNNAFVMAQSYGGRNPFIEFCLYDDGISIPGSLKRYDKKFNLVEDCELINKAVNGQSTKIEDDGRGCGINSSAQLIIDGFEGEMFIVSKNGAIYMKHGETTVRYNYPDGLDGTLIGLRVTKKRDVHWAQYADRKRSFVGKKVVNIDANGNVRN